MINQCQHTLGRIAVSISLSSARLDRSSGCKSSPFQKRLHDEYSLRCYQQGGLGKLWVTQAYMYSLWTKFSTSGRGIHGPGHRQPVRTIHQSQ